VTCREFAPHARFLRIVYCFRIVAYGMTWAGRAAGPSGSGIRRAAAAAASAGVILFALQPRGCLYAYVLASKRCKRSTTTTLLVVSSEFPAGCVACRPAEDSLSVDGEARYWLDMLLQYYNTWPN